MDINKIFIENTEILFSRLFTTKIVNKESYTIEEKTHNWNISALVGVTGDISGVISIRMRELLSSELLNRAKLTGLNKEIQHQLASDMLGELVNTIAGNVLSKAVKGKFRISVPIIIRGENHILQWPSNTPVIGIPIKTDFDGFEIQYSLQ